MQRRQLILGGLAAGLAGGAAAQTTPWRTLFDGKSFSGWTPIGDANWTLKDGAAQADKGGISFLVSNAGFGDFEARVEFWVSPEANSGVFIRCGDPTKIGVDNGYEFNIFDTRPDPSYGTGGIVNVAKVSPMPKAGGRWNVMGILAKGDLLALTLNGVKTAEGRDKAFTAGRIALQYGSGVVKFRKVEVRAA